jgi:hypothetical protein
VSQHHITSSTPIGANLVAADAIFRGRARALQVHVIGVFDGWIPGSGSFLSRDDRSRIGFVRAAQDGDNYKISGVGQESEGPKRALYASDRANHWPKANCILRAAGALSGVCIRQGD